MKSEAIVMTVDFGRNHFNAILLDEQLKMISSNGNIISLPGDNHKGQTEQTKPVVDQLIEFFKHS